MARRRRAVLVSVESSNRVRLQSSIIARNAVINLLGQGLPLIVAVLTTPRVVRGLGADRYGILAMALAVLGYFSLFDLGLGRAATRSVAAALGNDAEHRIPSIVWTTVITQATAGLIAAILLIVITPLLVEHLLNIPHGLWQEARPTFYVLAWSIPAVLVAGSFRGVLEAAQRFDLVNVVASPLSAANFLFPFIAVSLGWKLPSIVAVLLASRVTGALWFCLFCLRIFPALRSRPQFHGSEVKALIRFGGWVTVSSVVSPALVYLDRLMLGILTTMTAVAYYSAPYEMVTRLLIVPFSLAAILFPAFSQLHPKGDASAVDALTATSMKFLLLAFAPLVIALLGFSGDILRVWLGIDFARQSNHAVQILAVGLLANALAQLPYALIQGSNRPDITAKIHLSEIPLQLVTAWLFVRLWGITGAAAAWSLRTIIDLILLALIADRLKLFSFSAIRRARIPQVLLTVAVLCIVAVTISGMSDNVFLRASLDLAALAIAGWVAWFTFLTELDRAAIARWIPQLVGR